MLHTLKVSSKISLLLILWEENTHSENVKAMCIKLIIIFIFFFSFCDPVSRTEVTRLVEEFTSAFSFSGRVNNARGSRVAREAPKQEAKRSHYHEYAGSKAITSP